MIKKITMMTDQQLEQKFKDLCEDGLWTIFETKETKVPEKTHARARKRFKISTTSFQVCRPPTKKEKPDTE